MLRFSLGSMFLALLYLSVACAALVNGNGIWPQVAVTLTVAILLAFTLAAIFGKERRRVFAIAFSATGWLYLMLVFSDVTNIRPLLLTETAMARLYGTMHTAPPAQFYWGYAGLPGPTGQATVQTVVYAQPVPAPPTPLATASAQPSYFPAPVFPSSPTGGMAVTPVIETVDPVTFANIGHSLWAVMFGLVGGFIGQVLHSRSQRDPASGN